VKIFHSSSGIRELKGRLVSVRDRDHEFNVVTSVVADVLRDVSVAHPFGDHAGGALTPSRVSGTPMRSMTVGWGQALPHDNLYAGVLYGVSERR